jgi:hypothetical protein
VEKVKIIKINIIIDKIELSFKKFNKLLLFVISSLKLIYLLIKENSIINIKTIKLDS